jgi:hypothetical protein
MLMVILLAAIQCKSIQTLELEKDYSKFNIRFRYPRDMYFSVENGDENIGWIVGRLSARVHAFSVGWSLSLPLDTQKLSDLLGIVIEAVGLKDVVKGTTGKDRVKGHELSYTILNARLDSMTVDGAIGSWYCESTKRTFVLLSVGLGDGFDLFKKYLASFDCHPSSCIVATVAYGTGLSGIVQVLRDFRESQVRPTFGGSQFLRAFDRFYYSFSPFVSERIAQHESLKALTRIALRPLIVSITLSTKFFGVLDHYAETGIVAAGLVLSSLIGIMYLIPVGVTCMIVKAMIKKESAGRPRIQRVDLRRTALVQLWRVANLLAD